MAIFEICPIGHAHGELSSIEAHTKRENSLDGAAVPTRSPVAAAGGCPRRLAVGARDGDEEDFGSTHKTGNRFVWACARDRCGTPIPPARNRPHPPHSIDRARSYPMIPIGIDVAVIKNQPSHNVRVGGATSASFFRCRYG